MRFMLLRAVIFAALCAAAAGPASATGFVPFSTDVELVPSITGGATPVVLYSKQISYSNNDILQAIGEFEVSLFSPGGSVTGHVWAKLVLGTTAGDITGSVVLGVANQRVIRDPHGHHGIRVKGTLKKLTASSSPTTGYVNLVVWTDLDMTVEPSNGQLQGMVITPATGGATYTVYESTSELISSLPGDNVFRILYNVDLGDLHANDILVVFSDAQLHATGTVSGSQRLTTRLLRADPSGDGLSGTSLDQPNALTVTSTFPLLTPVRVAVQKVTAGSTARTDVNFLVQASSAALTVDDAGQLQVLKIRP